jgi:hypothetical protein
MKTKSTYMNTFPVVLFVLTTAVFSTATLAAGASNTDAAFGTAVPDADLANNRGGYTVQTSTNNLTATLGENQALSNLTGNNTVSSGAFTSTSGFATVVQNSGNNVIIQNSTIVNVELK